MEQLGRSRSSWILARCALWLGGCGVGELSAPDAVPPSTAAQSDAVDVAPIEEASSCAGCHPQQYAEWRSSNHAHAMRDRVFQALVAKQRSDLGSNASDLYCTQCHSPVGTKFGDVRPGLSFDALSPATMDGVSCSSCHQVTAVTPGRNAGHTIDLTAPRQGPLRDPVSKHASALSPLLGSALFCGSCHDVRSEGGLVLESPFEEWQSSPAARQGKSCQGCHMPTFAGKAANFPGAPERDGLHRHWFASVAGALELESEFEQEQPTLRAELAARADALLRESATLKLRVRSLDAERAELEVSVRSLIDGHDFPTGSTFFREFWLSVVVKDESGERLYASGDVANDQDLEAESVTDAQTGELVKLGTTLRDKRGARTSFPWRATTVEKRVVEPLATRSFSSAIELPTEARYPLTVDVRLCFRAFSPGFLRSLGLDEMARALVVRVVAEESTRIARPTPSLYVSSLSRNYEFATE